MVIEIDGKIHVQPENKAYDISRDIILKEFGIEIIRFSNEEVLNNPESVICKIGSTIEILKQKKAQKSNQRSDVD